MEEEQPDVTNDTTIISSPDVGNTWTSPLDISPNPGSQSHAWIVADGTTIHSAWHDYGSQGVAQIKYRKSTDDGLTWGSEVQITSNPTDSLAPVLVTTTNYVHMVYEYANETWYAKAAK
jgi:hypothetical protein